MDKLTDEEKVHLLRIDLSCAVGDTEKLARMVDRVVARVALLTVHVGRYVACGRFRSEDTTQAESLMEDVLTLGAEAALWADMVASNAKTAHEYMGSVPKTKQEA